MNDAVQVELFKRKMADFVRKVQSPNSAQEQEWIAMLERSRTQAISLGVETEADVERLSDEFSRTKAAKLLNRITSERDKLEILNSQQIDQVIQTTRAEKKRV